MAGTLLIWDYIITIQQEVKYIWLAKWTPGKVLYLGIRYAGMVEALLCFWVIFNANSAPTSCNVLVKLSLSIAYVTYLAGSLVFALRTWAIWNRSRWCGIVVGLAWTGNTISTIYSLVTNAIMATVPMENYDPSFLGCGAGPAPWDLTRSSIWGYCYAGYEAVIFALTLARGVRYLMKPTPLMHVLYRDAFVGSLVLFAVTMVFAILPTHVNNPGTFYWTYFIEVSFYFLVPWRIILNLREATMDLDGWDVTTVANSSPESYAMPDRGRGTGEGEHF